MPAGEYQVTEDEEILDSLTAVAYRRVATFFLVPGLAANRHTSRLVSIEYNDLLDALECDRKKAAG